MTDASQQQLEEVAAAQSQGQQALDIAVAQYQGSGDCCNLLRGAGVYQTADREPGTGVGRVVDWV